MKYAITTLILVAALGCFSFSQQIKLNGQLSIHNSKYNTGKIEYVKDVYITAPFAKPATSDDNGQFELEFVGIDAGTPVKVQVEKEGLEVVNDYELQRVVLGRIVPLQIYLTTKGQLAIAQTELYKISKAALLAQKDALIKRLHSNEAISKAAIAELKERLGRMISDRYEAEQLLNDKVEEMEKRLPEFAQSLAVQNLDFASELYIEAYEQFKKGNVEKVIQILDDAKLDRSDLELMTSITEREKLEEIVTDLRKKNQLQIIQNINNHELKAAAFNFQFNYVKAALEYEKNIKLCKYNQSDKEKLAIWYSRAAMAYYNDGKYEKALEYYQETLRIQEKILNPTHPDLASSYNDIGLVYHDKGEYDKALEYYEKALAIQEKVVGVKGLNIVNSYNNIGSTYQAKGEYEKALKYYEKALVIKEKLFGIEDPTTAITYNNIGVVYYGIGEYEKALEYYRKTLAVHEKVFGVKHPSLAASFSNIGNIYCMKDEYKKALDYYGKALVMNENVLGKWHPTTAISYNNIGGVHYRKGEYEEALEYYRKALAINEKVFNTQHPALATSFNNIGNVYSVKQDYEKALEYYEKALIIDEKVFGKEHARIATTYNNVGHQYSKMGEYERALEYYEKALTINENIFGKDHPNVAAAYNNIGLIYYAQMNDAKALWNYQKALVIFEKVLGKEHSSTGLCYYNIGCVYYANGEYEKALEYLLKVLVIREKIFGESHPSTQSCIIAISEAYILKGENQNGENYLERTTLSEYEKARTLNMDAVKNFKQNKYSESIKLYLAALIYSVKSDNPESDILRVYIYQNLAKAYCFNNNKDKAIPLFEKALFMAKEIKNEEIDSERIEKNYEDCKASK